MERILVKRVFDTPEELADVVERNERGELCHDSHLVTLEHFYVSNDGRHMICEYLAPDAEAVRRANRKMGLAYARLWVTEVVKPDEGSL